MSESFRPYEGNKPYIFVSYSGKNREQVFSILEAMAKAGYRIWYDAGIEAGVDWRDYIARRLFDCTVFIAFHSPDSAKSQHCRAEISQALDDEKTILSVYLEKDVPLSAGLKMYLKVYQGISYTTPDALMERIQRNQKLKICRENTVASERNAEESDLPPEIRELLRKARQGTAVAQNDLAICYWKGEGVEKDSAEAVKWYRNAAEQGLANAQYNLGVCYERGIGVEKDTAKAVKWYHKAAELGVAEAQKRLAELGVDP